MCRSQFEQLLKRLVAVERAEPAKVVVVENPVMLTDHILLNPIFPLMLDRRPPDVSAQRLRRQRWIGMRDEANELDRLIPNQRMEIRALIEQGADGDGRRPVRVQASLLDLNQCLF